MAVMDTSTPIWSCITLRRSVTVDSSFSVSVAAMRSFIAGVTDEGRPDRGASAEEPVFRYLK